jgi:hypothetical protein
MPIQETKNIYIVLADGFCKNNGYVNSECGGSFIIYKIGENDPHCTQDTLTKLIQTINRCTKNNKDSQNNLIQLLNTLCTDEHIISENLLFSLHNTSTNNGAEANTLLMVLSEINTLKLITPGNKIIVCMDSELTINQTTGLYKINNTELRNVHKSIQTMLKSWDNQLRKFHIEGVGGYPKLNEIFTLLYIPGDVMKKTRVDH